MHVLSGHERVVQLHSGVEMTSDRLSCLEALGTRKTVCACACAVRRSKEEDESQEVEAETGTFHVGSADSSGQGTASGASSSPTFCSSLLMGGRRSKPCFKMQRENLNTSPAAPHLEVSALTLLTMS